MGQKEILDYASKVNKEFTTLDLEFLGVGVNSLNANLRSLVRHGFIKRTGLKCLPCRQGRKAYITYELVS